MGPNTEISTIQPGSNPQVRYDLPAHITVNGDMGGRIASTGGMSPASEPYTSVDINMVNGVGGAI